MTTLRKLVLLLPPAVLLIALLWSKPVRGQSKTTIPERAFRAANGLVIRVRQVAPGQQPSDLQVICYFRHKPAGDTVIEALTDFDTNTGSVVSSLRNGGSFAGDERETLFFTPHSPRIKTKGILLIGLGREDDLSLETMGRIGTVALREAVRLRAGVVSYASAIKDQGVDKLDAGDVAEAFVHRLVIAYATEKRLQAKNLAPAFTVREWIYEAGPAYFAATVTHIQKAVDEANAEVSGL